MIHYKSFDSRFDIKSESSDGLSFKGYAAVFGNVDRVGEIVMRGAFTESLKSFSEDNPIPIYWNHQKNLPPIGTATAWEDDHGLAFDGVLFDTTLGKDVAVPMRRKAIKKMSFGYAYLPTDTKKSANGLELHKLSLIEISPVNSPANPLAEINSVKGIEDLYDSLYAIPRALNIVMHPDVYNERAREILQKFADECLKLGTDIQSLLMSRDPTVEEVMISSDDLDSSVIDRLQQILDDRSYLCSSI
jgi:HK97 family phage prohead protease